ncbi:Similar to Transposon MAGGYgagandpolgenehomologues, related [Eimeria brunetti]|uniref:Similar to Transposon MAGGYgagandpolgenehomologues, related n=1 Tax=Eimeria brunetti TaxID=51314 RepID=U6LMW3_9EIME|nr:Similar to Transposon MAGGYgagandpolgenehomologues, related [Eimeria brunetti]
MTPAQQRYSIYDQELLALVTALDKWRHLLRGAKVTAYTDHQALTFLQRINTQKPLQGSAARCLNFLAEFPALTITYLQGTRNRVADALSRHPRHAPADPTAPVLSSITPVVSQRPTRRLLFYSGELPGLPCRGGPSPVPASTDRPFHHPPASPPPDPPPPPEPSEPPHVRPSGADPLTPQRWEAAYPLCPHFREAFSALSPKPAGILQPFLVPSRRWSYVSLDFITDLPPTQRGHDSILVIVDSLSKMTHFIPTKKRASTADTIELLADRIIRYHGFPDVLISDRDPRIQSLLWQQLCRRFHINRVMSSAYHPQSDGQTERFDRTLEKMLCTYIQTDERKWKRLLPALELAHSTTSHSSN